MLRTHYPEIIRKVPMYRVRKDQVTQRPREMEQAILDDFKLPVNCN